MDSKPDQAAEKRKPYSAPKLIRYGGLTQPVLGGLAGGMADGKVVKGFDGKT